MSKFIIIAKQSGIDVYYGTRCGKRTELGSLPEWLSDLSEGDCYYSEKRAKELAALLKAHYKDSGNITDIQVQQL